MTVAAPPRTKEPADPAQADQTARLRAVIGRLSRRLRSTASASQLTPSQISVLFTIVRHGPLGLSELASIEGLNPTMLSRIAAQLGDMGLITRTADPLDRRAALVAATGVGRRLRERIHRERAQALWRALPVLEELAARLPAPGR